MGNNDSVAIITGGGQGIGKYMAKRFLESGYKVVIAEIDKEAGQETEKDFSTINDIKFNHCDISDAESVETMIGETIKEFGKLDVLVNNAAISINKPMEELTIEEWNRVIAVNLSGAFICSKYCTPYLRKSKGVIINLASTRAFMSEPHTEAYSATKGGIYALTHAMAISLAPNVRVNCISPGWIETTEWKKRSERHAPELSDEDHKQHPAGRVGTPDDIASLALFLAHPENSFITGANFIVDGGMTRKMIYI